VAAAPARGVRRLFRMTPSFWLVPDPPEEGPVPPAPPPPPDDEDAAKELADPEPEADEDETPPDAGA